MKFNASSLGTDALATQPIDALVVVLAGDSLPATLDKAVQAIIKDALKLGDFELKPGRVLTVTRPVGLKATRLLVAAAGNANVKAARTAIGLVFGQLKSRGAAHATVAYLGFEQVPSDALAEQTALAALDAVYVYRHTKPSAPADSKLGKVTFLAEGTELTRVKAGLSRGEAIGAGIHLARECANLPPNVATPAFLADQARSMVRPYGVKVEVFDEKGLAKLGMGSFLSVAQGSSVPPRFIVARYDGAAKTQAPLVLIGKGITFDSGGISLKPGASMDEMKFDMCGAASVLGTLRAIVGLRPKINLVVLIAACENMPSGNAVKPGDVVTSMSGQTIEVLNTDAEGRLVLCDALTYAERFKPSAVVDVATLTGACVVALGGVRSGMYANDDRVAEALEAAGEAALDLCWRMPLDDDYAEGLKSNFADVANLAGRDAGSITAAKFLQRFASKFRWGHLDIAGTAWKSGDAKGSTGRPVGLLTHFVLSQAG